MPGPRVALYQCSYKGTKKKVILRTAKGIVVVIVRNSRREMMGRAQREHATTDVLSLDKGDCTLEAYAVLQAWACTIDRAN